jgi:hypothetical protein
VRRLFLDCANVERERFVNVEGGINGPKLEGNVVLFASQLINFLREHWTLSKTSDKRFCVVVEKKRRYCGASVRSCAPASGTHTLHRANGLARVVSACNFRIYVVEARPLGYRNIATTLSSTFLRYVLGIWTGVGNHVCSLAFMDSVAVPHDEAIIFLRSFSNSNGMFPG